MAVYRSCDRLFAGKTRLNSEVQLFVYDDSKVLSVVRNGLLQVGPGLDMERCCSIFFAFSA